MLRNQQLLLISTHCCFIWAPPGGYCFFLLLSSLFPPSWNDVCLRGSHPSPVGYVWLHGGRTNTLGISEASTNLLRCDLSTISKTPKTLVWNQLLLVWKVVYKLHSFLPRVPLLVTKRAKTSFISKFAKKKIFKHFFHEKTSPQLKNWVNNLNFLPEKKTRFLREEKHKPWSAPQRLGKVSVWPQPLLCLTRSDLPLFSSIEWLLKNSLLFLSFAGKEKVTISWRS